VHHFQAFVGAWLLTVAFSATATSQTVAETGFNDTSGVHADGTPASPYTLGATVDGRPAAEPGWAGPWRVSFGSAANALVQTAVVFEGDGALSLDGTVRVDRQLGTPPSGIVTLAYHFRAESGAGVTFYFGNPGTPGSPSDLRQKGPVWSAAPDGTVKVVDGVGNGCDNVAPAPPCTEEDTGFRWIADTWHDVSIVVDVQSQTWRFFFDDSEYTAPDPLGFRGAPTLSAMSELTWFSNFTSVYVDSIVVAVASSSACSDADGDGENDERDQCPGTGAGAAVDSAGCSQQQFCAAFDATNKEGARICRKADWGNDEPLMKAKQADCEVEKGGRGRGDDRCVPRP
jgi:hypothetical protein